MGAGGWGDCLPQSTPSLQSRGPQVPSVSSTLLLSLPAVFPRFSLLLINAEPLHRSWGGDTTAGGWGVTKEGMKTRQLLVGAGSPQAEPASPRHLPPQRSSRQQGQIPLQCLLASLAQRELAWPSHASPPSGCFSELSSLSPRYLSSWGARRASTASGLREGSSS